MPRANATDLHLGTPYAAARAWAGEWRYFFDGQHLDVLREITRGHRAAADLVRDRAPDQARELGLAVAYLEALLPAPPEGAAATHENPA